MNKRNNIGYWSNLGLQARLVLSMALIILIGASIVSYLFMKSSAAENQILYKEYSSETFVLLHDSIITAHNNNDHGGGQDLLNAQIRKGHGITRLEWEVFNGGNFIAEYSAPPLRAPKWFVYLLDIVPYESTHPIIINSENVGQLTILFSPDNANNKLWHRFKKQVQIVSLAMLFIFFAIIALLRSHLVGLQKMSVAAHALSEGNYSVRILPDGSPEMRSTVNAFNEMAAEVQRQMRFTEALIEAFPNPVFYKNTQGYYLGVNRAWEDFFGVAKEDAIGKTIAELCAHVPKLLLIHERKDRELWQTPGTQRYETEVITLTGRHYQTLYSKATFTSQDGEVGGMIGTIIDLSDIKNAEEKARQASVDKLSAEASNRAKDTFLATMSHELRTPLNSVILLSEWLINGVKQGDKITHELCKHTEIIHSSAQHLLGIINNILDFAQIETGKIEFTKTYFDLPLFINGLISIVTPQIQEKGLSLITHIDDALPEVVFTDKVRLQQVLLNLLSNSVKFTSKGEIDLRVEIERSEEAAVLRITVTDMGIGIPQHAQDKVFQLYKQANEFIGKCYGGTGLGLAITREIMERLDGEVSFTSTEGKGSRFQIKLPVEVADHTVLARGQTDIALKSAVTSKPLHILVAEDDPVNQFVIKELLKNRGHRVDLVSNGVDALSYLDGGLYDVAILDFNMPDKDGITVAREWRAREQGRALRIIILTADVTITAIEEYRECIDVVGYKPIDTASLLSVVESEYLDKSMQPLHHVTLLSDSNDKVYLDKERLASITNDVADNGYIGRLTVKLDKFYTEKLKELRGFMKKQDASACRDVIHHLKGGASTMGAVALASQLSNLDALPDTELLKNGEKITDDLTTLLEETIILLRDYAQQGSNV